MNDLFDKSRARRSDARVIAIRGAREHNLKNVDVEIPRDQLIVFTGLSGSGKSSLAFDTIYAEGQRRYVESLSAYARQFLGQMDKPDVDFIEGLSPAISIDQKSASRNPRSTVGTITEIYDYLRLLYARIGKPHCPNCGAPIARQSPSQIVDQVMALKPGTRFQVLAPIARGKKGEFEKVLEDLAAKGFARARVDGLVIDLAETGGTRLDKYYKHDIEVIVDRLVLKPDIGRRLSDSIETALGLTEGIVGNVGVKTETMLFSERAACLNCGLSFDELAPRNFSFNTPYGACPHCDGIGTHLEVDAELVVPDPDRSIAGGAIGPWSSGRLEYFDRMLEAVAETYGFSTDTPWGQLTPAQQEVVLQGTGDTEVFIRYRNRYGRTRQYHTTFEGVVPWLERRRQEAESDTTRERIEQFFREVPCPVCKGARLRPESLAVTVGGLNIWELSRLSAQEAAKFVGSLELTDQEAAIATRILKEVDARLGFLVDVGLDYLTIERGAATLAGGEAQRIRLATQIGSGLVGVLYILDEPSIGLHPRDNRRLIDTLIRLRDLGNTVLVVEHDAETMRRADYILDLGPGPGVHGGAVVAQGSPAEVMANKESLTGQYLRGDMNITLPHRARQAGRHLTVVGAREHNLKNIAVKIPLGLLTCVTGVSGSGKSTLLFDVLYRSLRQLLYHKKPKIDGCKELLGADALDKVIDIDQSPIGRTPRSNPATYTGLFSFIRDLYSNLPESRVRGYKPGRYSFNVKGGRCEACQGDGLIKIEMHFLPDVYVSCEVCRGKRYNSETLAIQFKGLSIADLLNSTVADALNVLGSIPQIHSKLQTLVDVGLGYIGLGQPATTLSGGEAQRIKLAKELSRRATGKTLYILDEPTTGLHFHDVAKLLEVLHELADAGNTVVVIEHNLEVIKTADWILDMGPEGGDGGGRIVAQGTPEDVAKVKESHTARYLKDLLGRRSANGRGKR